MKILYLTNIEVPYRTEFFNQLSKNVSLTVLYERNESKNRNKNWTKSEKSIFKSIYLNGFKIFNEFSVDFNVIKYVLNKEHDIVVFGCLNSVNQIISMLVCRVLKRKYILNLDGEYFFEEKSAKKFIKKYLVKGADKYFVAGKGIANRLGCFVEGKRIWSYNFSSLTSNEVKFNSRSRNQNITNEILVIGQFVDYKGLEYALECAKLDSKNKYVFIGSNDKSRELLKKVEEKNISNVEIISFLSKAELNKKYSMCKMVLLPSVKECWGLVISEAASFGCPIISTCGSGAAKEYLQENFRELLAETKSGRSLFDAVKLYENQDYVYRDKLSKFLIEKSRIFTIDNNVQSFCNMIREER